MNASKILLIIQTGLMYLSHFTLWIMIIFALKNPDASSDNTFSMTCAYIFWILFLLLILVSVVNIIVSLCLFSHPKKDITKFTMILKLIHIPWYIFNFILASIIAILMINPFLIIYSPLFILVIFLITYLFIVSSSLPLCSYLFANKKLENSKDVPLLFVLLFIDVLDVLSSILIYSSLQKKNKISN